MTSSHAAAVTHRPDPLGHFGAWGGRFVPEVLMAALDQLTEAFEDAIEDPSFNAELDALRRDYAGRPTPLFPARRLSEQLGLQVWLKREDLLHTGARRRAVPHLHPIGRRGTARPPGRALVRHQGDFPTSGPRRP